jgi:hypothetical protein
VLGVHAGHMREEIELRIALDPAGGDRLGGRLLSPRGESRPFDGWLGLISAIDAELSSQADPQLPPVQREGNRRTRSREA